MLNSGGGLLSFEGATYQAYYVGGLTPPGLSGCNGCDIGPTQSSQFDVGTFQFEAASVPEPDTWAILLLGLGAVGMTLRRQRSALTA